jgi:hypothetical protein
MLFPESVVDGCHRGRAEKGAFVHRVKRGGSQAAGAPSLP